MMSPRTTPPEGRPGRRRATAGAAVAAVLVLAVVITADLVSRGDPIITSPRPVARQLVAGGGWTRTQSSGAVPLSPSASDATRSTPLNSTSSPASSTPSPATTASPGTTAARTGPPASWKLVFNSDFSASSTLNSSIWGRCYPVAPNGCTNYATGTEREWYLPSQDHVSGGVLHMVAKREPTSGWNSMGKPKQYACRSGMVTTYPGFHFEYGYLQVTARIPFAYGLWPALWLAAANGKWPPEIDILEHWDSSGQAKVYLHPLSGIRQGGPFPAPGINVGWHTFSISWTRTRLSWIVDGRVVLSTTVGIPHQSMYFIADLADVHNPYQGCSGSLDIKSVKVWQP